MQTKLPVPVMATTPSGAVISGHQRPGQGGRDRHAGRQLADHGLGRARAVQDGHVPIEVVSAAASGNPARVLGMDDGSGANAVGQAAELVVLDSDLLVTGVLVTGAGVGRAQDGDPRSVGLASQCEPVVRRRDAVSRAGESPGVDGVDIGATNVQAGAWTKVGSCTGGSPTATGWPLVSSIASRMPSPGPWSRQEILG